MSVEKEMPEDIFPRFLLEPQDFVNYLSLYLNECQISISYFDYHYRRKHNKLI